MSSLQRSTSIALFTGLILAGGAVCVAWGRLSQRVVSIEQTQVTRADIVELKGMIELVEQTQGEHSKRLDFIAKMLSSGVQP